MTFSSSASAPASLLLGRTVSAMRLCFFFGVGLGVGVGAVFFFFVALLVPSMRRRRRRGEDVLDLLA